MATNRITWSPSGDSNVINAGHYDIQSAPDSSGSPGTWAPLATVNDVRPGPAYSGGLFFYDDLAGATTTWYRVRVVDGASQASAYSAAFQAGVLAPVPTDWTSESLLESAKRRGSIPTAQVTFTDDDLLAMADEEILTRFAPLLVSANEDYLLTQSDAAIAGQLDGTKAYRVSPRAIGAKLRGVYLVDSSGMETVLPRVPPESNEQRGFYIRSGYIFPLSDNQGSYVSLRQRFYLRPSRLVGTDQAGYITGVDLANNRVSIGNVPLGFVTGATFDIIKGGSPFDVALADAVGTWNGVQLTVPSLPADIAVGDVVCIAGTTNVPQLPAEWHPVLAQALATKALEVLGDNEGAMAASSVLQGMQGAALGLVSNRVESNVKVIPPSPSSFWRRR
jgi:hypothetical protein